MPTANLSKPPKRSTRKDNDAPPNCPQHLPRLVESKSERGGKLTEVWRCPNCGTIEIKKYGY